MSAIEGTLQPGLDKDLTSRQKILIGGVGALAPIVINLLAVDPKTTFANISVLIMLGYLFRVGVFFCIGGGMAWLHKNEKSAIKLFELGIVAPAILIGLMNGNKIDNGSIVAGNAPPSATAGVLDWAIPTAYAKEMEPEIKTYTRPEQSVTSQLWQGISGNQDGRVWFVVAGTFKTNQLPAARELINKIAHSSPGYDPQIYKNDTHYAVVIGANLTLSQAKARKGQAEKDNLPTYGDIYLFNPWESK